jgi:hypothetical protein
MQTTTKDIDNYLASLPDEVGDDVKHLDAIISKIMKGQSRTLWQGKFWGGSEQTIIGYGDMSYTRSDKQIVQWFKVGLALQKNYLSVYISTYPVKNHAAKLGKVKAGASSISFKKLEDVNLDELKKLVEIAKTRM